MARKKTKKQKQKISLSRKNRVEPKGKLHQVDYSYDPSLLSKDLLRTVVVSLIVLGGQLVLYFTVFK